MGVGVQHNYPPVWVVPERMEGLTLDLGLDDPHSLQPREFIVDEELEPCWRYFGSLQAAPETQTDAKNVGNKVDNPSNSTSTTLGSSLLNPIKLEPEDEIYPPTPVESYPLPTDLTVAPDYPSQHYWMNYDTNDVEQGSGNWKHQKRWDIGFDETVPAEEWRKQLPQKAFIPHTQGITEVSYGMKCDPNPTAEAEGSSSSINPCVEAQLQMLEQEQDSDEEFMLDDQYADEDVSFPDSPLVETGLSQATVSGPKESQPGCNPAPIKAEKIEGRDAYGWIWSPSDQSMVRQVNSAMGLGLGERRTSPVVRKESSPHDGDVGGQVQPVKPNTEMNPAVKEMPQDTPEAFRALSRLVETSSARAFVPEDEYEARLEPVNLSRGSPQAVAPAFVKDNDKQHANVVLFDPKPNPTDQSMEETRVVVHVKEEWPPCLNVAESTAVAPTREIIVNGVRVVVDSRTIIRTALTTFEKCRLELMKNPSYGQPNSESPALPVNTKRLRADLKAACMMRKSGFWLNENRPIGEVQGVAIGDFFRYRIEMAIIGLHRAVQAGIAVVPLEHSPYNRTVASSVVIGVSDPYQDDKDMGDTVVYSGQGGLSGKTGEFKDQELKRGNLALSNSYDLKLPIRLIRGHKDPKSKIGVLYSYDGLYQVNDMQYVTGVNGKKVFKFMMQRLPGQAPIVSPAAPSVQYPVPLGSHLPSSLTSVNPASQGSQSLGLQPSSSHMHGETSWMQSPDIKPLLYLAQHPEK